MNKGLVYINGQEGFIDLELPLRIRICRDDIAISDICNYLGMSIFNSGARIEEPLPNIFSQKATYYTHRYGMVIKNAEAYKRLIILNINSSNLSCEFFKLYTDYDSELDKLTKKQKQFSKSYFKAKNKNKKKNCKRRYNHYSVLIGKLLRLKTTSGYQFPYKIIVDLLKYIPLRYKSIQEETYNCKIGNYCYKIIITTLKIDYHSIPYFEQQFQLKRIELTEKEKCLVYAMKEMMRIKEENITFDDYISNWAKKLLKK